MPGSSLFAGDAAETALINRRLDPKSQRDCSLVREDVYRFVINTYEKFYPGVQEWYRAKIITGFLAGSRIIHVVQRGNDNGIVGLSISKISDKRYDKLCSFLILPEARNTGIGTQLMGATLASLSRQSGTKPIVMTLPEDRATEPTDHK